MAEAHIETITGQDLDAVLAADWRLQEARGRVAALTLDELMEPSVVPPDNESIYASSSVQLAPPKNVYFEKTLALAVKEWDPETAIYARLLQEAWPQPAQVLVMPFGDTLSQLNPAHQQSLARGDFTMGIDQLHTMKSRYGVERVEYVGWFEGAAVAARAVDYSARNSGNPVTVGRAALFAPPNNSVRPLRAVRNVLNAEDSDVFSQTRLSQARADAEIPALAEIPRSSSRTGPIRAIRDLWSDARTRAEYLTPERALLSGLATDSVSADIGGALSYNHRLTVGLGWFASGRLATPEAMRQVMANQNRPERIHALEIEGREELAANPVTRVLLTKMALGGVQRPQ